MRRVDYDGQEYLIHTRSGMRLIHTMREMGIPVQCECGSKDEEAAGKCSVKFERSQLFLLNSPNEFERKVLGDKIEQGYRLACQALYK